MQTKEQVGTYVVGGVAFVQSQELLGMEHQGRVCCSSAYLRASGISRHLMQQAGYQWQLSSSAQQGHGNTHVYLDHISRGPASAKPPWHTAVHGMLSGSRTARSGHAVVRRRVHTLAMHGCEGSCILICMNQSVTQSPTVHHVVRQARNTPSTETTSDLQ